MILWFNTGTLRNIASRNRSIESSPRNDRLGYLFGIHRHLRIESMLLDSLVDKPLGILPIQSERNTL